MGERVGIDAGRVWDILAKSPRHGEGLWGEVQTTRLPQFVACAFPGTPGVGLSKVSFMLIKLKVRERRGYCERLRGRKRALG